MPHVGEAQMSQLTNRVARAAALYPIDTIKTRLQLVRTGGGIRALIQAGGGKALYAGIWGNLLGVAPSTGVFMAIYEPLKQVRSCATAALPAPL